MIQIYSDGSCTPNPGGPGAWAFAVFDYGDEVHHASGPIEGGSNNIAELRALIEALRWAGPRTASIYSDSQYVVNGVNQWSRGWIRRNWMRLEGRVLVPVANGDLWRELVSLKGPHHRVAWVRGHNGNPGNERADELAGEERQRLVDRLAAAAIQTASETLTENFSA